LPSCTVQHGERPTSCYKGHIPSPTGRHANYREVTLIRGQSLIAPFWGRTRCDGRSRRSCWTGEQPPSQQPGCRKAQDLNENRCLICLLRCNFCLLLVCLCGFVFSCARAGTRTCRCAHAVACSSLAKSHVTNLDCDPVLKALMQQASRQCLLTLLLHQQCIYGVSAELVKNAQRRRSGNYCERKPCCRHVNPKL
jgi:hypothetical protein